MAHLRPTTLACALGGIVVALAMALGAPRTTPAETVEEMEQSIREMEQSIEEMGRQVQDAAAVYAEAMANVEVLQSSIDENQGRIDVVEREIPEQRERSASAIRTLYKMSQNKNGLIDLMLSSDDFNSFITTMTYMNIIEERNTDEAERLVRLQNELRSVEAELNAQHDEAEQEREKADEALRQAEELRSKAIEEKARLEAEQRARKAAEEAAKAAQAAAQANAQALIGSDDLSALADAVAKAGPTNQPIPNQPAPATPPSDEPGIEAPPSNPDRDSFVQEWAQRIDQYLAGSPLEGHGRTFAEAAYDFGVDPRWSPAISNTESTKGRFCFLPHNAWGWGQASWPDWDTAIRAHVQGLSEGYGYTISEANAEKYCPPTWQAWYATTLAEMAKI